MGCGLNNETCDSAFRLVLLSLSPASDKDRYLLIGACSRTTGASDTDGSGPEYPQSTENIINLVKQFILPCGMAGPSSGGKISSILLLLALRTSRQNTST